MSEKTVKIEVEVPEGLHRFLKDLAEFIDLRGEDMNEYVVSLRSSEKRL